MDHSIPSENQWQCLRIQGEVIIKIKAMSSIKYIPALRFKWLTPWYDFIVGMTLPEKKIKEALIKLASVSAQHKVLDFGCGTGTLTIMTKQAVRGVDIVGIDIDRQILKKAIRRVREKELDIKLIEYDGNKLPFDTNQFDKIISSLVFHHLDTSEKQKVLSEIYRTLSPKGELYIADFGRSDSLVQRFLFNSIRILDGFQPTKANAEGSLPLLISKAGFKYVSINKRFKTIFGEVQVFKATKNL